MNSENSLKTPIFLQVPSSTVHISMLENIN